jgi:hypothetical protein
VIGPRLRSWIVIVVLCVWAINFVASLIPWLKYETDPQIHVVFMAIVGGVIALGAKGNGNGNGNGNGKDGDGK